MLLRVRRAVTFASPKTTEQTLPPLGNPLRAVTDSATKKITRQPVVVVVSMAVGNADDKDVRRPLADRMLNMRESSYDRVFFDVEGGFSFGERKCARRAMAKLLCALCTFIILILFCTIQLVDRTGTTLIPEAITYREVDRFGKETFSKMANDESTDQRLEKQAEQKFGNNRLLVLVMSARGNVAERRVIRETWASNHTDVFFIIGDDFCEIPPDYQSFFSPCDIEPSFSETTSSLYQTAKEKHLVQEKFNQAVLQVEASSFGDILLLQGVKDSYGNLAAKTKGAVLWAAVNRPDAWVLKIDDDSIAFIDRLKESVAELDSNAHVLFGEIFLKNYVLSTGKWAEVKYNATELYPPYAQGAAGYVLSPTLVQTFHRNADKLDLYRCEDASVGIWIRELGLTSVTQFVHDKRFRCDTQSGFNSCSRETESGFLTYSHKFTAPELLKCYNIMKALDRVVKVEEVGLLSKFLSFFTFA